MANYIIQIPEPCSEDWNQMTPLEKGRFCAVCEKEIYDFSTYTKQELINRIKKGDKLCGRVLSNHLETELVDSTGIKGLKMNGLVAAAINLLVLTTTSSMQGQESVPTVQLTKALTMVNEAKIRTESDSRNSIYGQVVDEYKQPIAGTYIEIKALEIVGTSDLEGNFKLELPRNYNKTLEVDFQFIGMKNKKIKVKDLVKPLLVVLQEDDNVLGEVVIVRKKKWLFF